MGTTDQRLVDTGHWTLHGLLTGRGWQWVDQQQQPALLIWLPFGSPQQSLGPCNFDAPIRAQRALRLFVPSCAYWGCSSAWARRGAWHATCTILRRGCVGETHGWGAPPMIVGRANARMGNPAGEV